MVTVDATPVIAELTNQLNMMYIVLGALGIVIMFMLFLGFRFPSQRAIAKAAVRGAAIWVEHFRNSASTLVTHTDDHGWHHDVRRGLRFFPMEEEVYYLDGKIPVYQAYEENAKAILHPKKLAIVSSAMIERQADTVDDLEAALNLEDKVAKSFGTQEPEKEQLVQALRAQGKSDDEIAAQVSVDSPDGDGDGNSNRDIAQTTAGNGNGSNGKNSLGSNISGTIRLKSILTSLRSDANPRAVSLYGRQREQIGKWGKEESDNSKKIIAVAIMGFLLVVGAVVAAPYIQSGLGGGGQKQQQGQQGQQQGGFPDLGKLIPNLNPGQSGVK